MKIATRRLALIGARADFTRAVLAGLLAGGVRPLLVLLYNPPAAAGEFAVETRKAVDGLAITNGIAVRSVDSGAQALDACTGSGAEVGLVACFPRRLPVESAALPPLGLFNLHPAPLPAYRGPTPLFWQFRAGATRTAVSLHRVSGRFDTGAVLASAPLALEAGSSLAVTNEKLAALGADLAIAHLLRVSRIAAGARQDEARASYHVFPHATALRLSTRWPAERLYRFVAATAGVGRQFRLFAGGTGYALDRVTSFDAQATQARAVVQGPGTSLWIRCTAGLVHAHGRVFP